MITMDLRRIKCAKELQDTVNQAMKVVEDALTPRLTDWTQIEIIYQHFKDFIKKIGPHHSERRREFLFIVVMLYCPSVLIGGSMPRGFRGKLKDLLKVESPSAISNYTSDLLFLYNHYQDFRDVVVAAYWYISAVMGWNKPKEDDLRIDG